MLIALPSPYSQIVRFCTRSHCGWQRSHCLWIMRPQCCPGKCLPKNFTLPWKHHLTIFSNWATSVPDPEVKLMQDQRPICSPGWSRQSKVNSNLAGTTFTCEHWQSMANIGKQWLTLRIIGMKQFLPELPPPWWSGWWWWRRQGWAWGRFSTLPPPCRETQETCNQW